MNPWKEIALDDYENHMSLDSVKQLQIMNTMTKNQFYDYDSKRIVFLGIAGGNGLEHIDPIRISKVYGVDINADYLENCKKRYQNLGDVLETLQVDLTKDEYCLPCADLLVANLLIEYIGYQNFQRAVNKVAPKIVSCIIQINMDDSFVSDSPYLHAFDRLDEIHYQMSEMGLDEAMEDINYKRIAQQEEKLPNSKKLVRLDYCEIK